MGLSRLGDVVVERFLLALRQLTEPAPFGYRLSTNDAFVSIDEEPCVVAAREDLAIDGDCGGDYGSAAVVTANGVHGERAVVATTGECAVARRGPLIGVCPGHGI